MSEIAAFIAAHQVIATLAAYWIFSAAVSAMPKPIATSSAAYVWLYTFLRLIAANIDQYVQSKGGTVPIETKKPDSEPKP